MTAKVIVLIQARMGSTRFPKKMMAPLKGLPMIEWVLKRCAAAKTVDKVVLATSDLERDKVLIDHANQCGFDSFSGSEPDVLARFVKAAQHHNADIVVRICGDRPLVAPEAIDAAVSLYQSDQCDLTFNHIPDYGEQWPKGFGSEVVSRSLLEHIEKNFSDEFYREHVTSYIWEKRNDFKIKASSFDCQVRDPHLLRFDVDTRDDLDALERLDGITISSSIQDILDVYSASQK